MDYQTKYEKINWDQTILDVNERFNALKVCWHETETRQPELHKKLVRDLYMPALECLARFVTSVKIE